MTPKQKIKMAAMFSLAHSDNEKGLNARAFFKTNNRNIGEDLVQDTFMKTWSYLVKGGKIELMKAFLYHILNNLIIDQYRKHKTTSLDFLIEKGFDPPGESNRGDINETLFRVLDGKASLLLIAELPPTYQKVMRMKYVQDLSLSEMSLLTGQSKNSLAVQLHRGLEKLKVLYKR